MKQIVIKVVNGNIEYAVEGMVHPAETLGILEFVKSVYISRVLKAEADAASKIQLVPSIPGLHQ